ncbi:MAG: DUF4012 domain-containing protein [bacterium]
MVNHLLPLLRLAPNSNLARGLPIYEESRFILPYWSYIFGYGRPTTYLILLQNDTEMRANGGFFGSYAVVTLTEGVMETRFQDIYVPDGQLGGGHVEAPKPVEEAFGNGGYMLRDTDWEPDFEISAKTIRWFFEKGEEINPDVMMTVSLSTIKKILQIVGPIVLDDYQLTIDETNVFNLVQAKVETDFFPGSTQKKEILSDLGQALLTKLESLPLKKKLEIANILWQEAKRKNILVNSTNLEFQSILKTNQLTGSLRYPNCTGKVCTLDTYLAVESNLGANKANCCTRRVTTHKITDNQDYYTHDVEIFYTNDSSEENPKLPDFFGGNYIDYLRLFIPGNSTNIQIEAEPTLPTTTGYPAPYTNDASRLESQEYEGFKMFGLFHITRAGSSSRVLLRYDLPKITMPYELHILKQHGMVSSSQIILIGEKRVETNLEDDFVLSGE